MPKKHLLSGLWLTGMLSGCNAPGGLIPPADIGDTSMPSYERQQTTIARAAPTQEVYSSDAAPLQPAYEGDTQGDAAGYAGYSSNGQNSLEAQAEALNSGAIRSPAASAPLEDGAMADEQEEPRPVRRRQPQQTAESQDFDQPLPPPADASAPPAAAAAEPRQVASKSEAVGNPSIRFLPIIGAPVEKVTPLSRQLGSEARARGITIRGSNDEASDYILKGYLSAFEDGGKINVVYVWDVLDGSGARLHRIQGQESVAGGGADPWAAVPASVMQSIGTRTIGEYLSWRQSSAG